MCLVIAIALAIPAVGSAQDRDEPPEDERADQVETKGEPEVFDFTGMDLSGRLRTPQLLYFLDRASEELQRASLERRSFIPEMVRSVDEEPL